MEAYVFFMIGVGQALGAVAGFLAAVVLPIVLVASLYKRRRPTRRVTLTPIDPPPPRRLPGPRE